ncbi:hypothetical protein JCM10207_005473 [Rhodosporidiobolus poonsookiae]
MSMDKLPDKLILAVAELLGNNRGYHVGGPAPGQHALCALARTSKRFLHLVSPILYAGPRLFSRKAVSRWIRTYSSLVNPFKLARAKTARYPDPLKPSSLFISFDEESLPVLTSDFDHLGLFDNLTSLTVMDCSLDTNFLPTLLAPGEPLRDTLQNPTILGGKLKDEEECPEFVNALCFIFEAVALSDVPGRSLRVSSTEALDLGWLSEEDVAGMQEDAEPEDDEDYSALSFAFIFRAHHEWSFFTRVWRDTGYAPPSDFPSFSHLASLRKLQLEITNPGLLYLIIYTSSFPSLRNLTLETNVITLYLSVNDVQTLRFAITGPSDEKHGTLEPPFLWDDEDYSELNKRLHLDLKPGDCWPPLSVREQDAYPDLPYQGPRLEWLRLDNALLALDDE